MKEWKIVAERLMKHAECRRADFRSPAGVAKGGSYRKRSSATSRRNSDKHEPGGLVSAGGGVRSCDSAVGEGAGRSR